MKLLIHSKGSVMFSGKRYGPGEVIEVDGRDAVVKELVSRGLAVEVTDETDRLRTKNKRTRPGAGSQSRWQFDPKTLEKKSLDEMRLMIEDLLHTDETGPEITDEASAREWLSQDFKG